MQGKIGNSLINKLRSADKPYEICDTDLKGFILRVQPTGSMTYLVSYRNRGGKRNRVTLGRHPVITAAQARDEARRILAGIIQGSDPAEARRIVVAQEHTLRTFLENEYGPWVKAHRKDGMATLDRLLRFSSFLDIPLKALNAKLVEKWRSDRLNQGIKPATTNRDMAALKSALSKAVEWGCLETHPLTAVKPSSIDQVGIVRFLTDDEETRLRQALDAREAQIRHKRATANQWRRERNYPEMPDLTAPPFADHLKPMVLLSINTGLRQGELFRLDWKSIDLDRAIMTVRGETAKSGRTRYIPLNKEAAAIFSEWRQQQASHDGLVFPGPNGTPLDNIKTSWHSLLQQAQVTDFRWHDLRHHFASRLVMAGVDLNTVRELLGHSDLKMTLRYAHLAPEHKAQAVAKLIK